MNKYRIFLSIIFLNLLPPILSYRHSNFEQFANNENVKRLIDEYQQHKIKTQEQLLEKLREINVNISERTLREYLIKIKVQFNSKIKN